MSLHGVGIRPAVGVNCFLYTPLHTQHKRGVLGGPWLGRENERGRKLGPVLGSRSEQGDVLLGGLPAVGSA